MAKRGVVYYCMMSVSWGIVGYLFYAHFKSVKKLPDYKNVDIEEQYAKAEGKPRIITQNELRLMSERTKVEKVPLADQKSGYM
jgi:hypothetical protein